MEHFDEDATRLREALHDEPIPPATLDVGVLVRGGRRRVRVRRLAATGGVAGVTALALLAAPLVVNRPAARPGGEPTAAPPEVASADRGQPPTVPTACQAHRLPVPPGARESLVLDGDPTGRYLVGVARDTRGRGAWTLLWDQGKLTVLAVPDPDTDLRHVVVNSAGVVAGAGTALVGGSERPVAWVYRAGRFSRLTGADVVHEVTDINTRGDVLGVGTVSARPDSSGRAPADPRPLVWPADGGAPRKLAAAPDGGPARAAGIDDDGTVVGRLTQPAADWTQPAADTGPPVDRGLVWRPDGSVGELPGAGQAVRSGHVLILTQQRPGGPPTGVRPARIDPADGTPRPVTGLAHATAITRYGWVAGFVRDPDGTERPAVDAGGQLLVLPEFEGAVPSKEGPAANALSDDGRTLGGFLMVRPAGRTVAVRWTCG